MLIYRKSMATGKLHSMDLPVTDEQFSAWNRGVLIQDAFSNLTESEREFLLSGITPEEWAVLFPKNEEEDV